MDESPIASGDAIDPVNPPTLYALLVGIADYASEIRLEDDTVKFPRLLGCQWDANRMKEYLGRDDYYKTDIKLVVNEHATKPEIARLFLEHLGKAKENDIALFYFSGHGTQEYTDKALFPSETDGKLESVVCYYDEDHSDDFLLSDKELRWLIGRVAGNKPHIVTIFDCCHSAGMTRNAGFLKTVLPVVVEKRAPYVFKQRAWDKFIFSGSNTQGGISEQDMISNGEFHMLPEAAHIQLSACESDESAIEVSGEGVFTSALLKVLKSANGKLSYNMLNNRVRQYLRSVYEQKPRIYTAGVNHPGKFSTFLNKPFDYENQELGDITYNTQLGWQLNLGSIHGISKSGSGIIVYDPAGAGNTFTAEPETVRTDSTVLIIQDGLLDQNKVYKATVKGLMKAVLRLFVSPGNVLPDEHLALIIALTRNGEEFIELAELEDEAHYTLRYESGHYFITLPNDPYRPLTTPVNVGSGEWIDAIHSGFEHISRHTFIKNLINQENNKLPDDVLTIQIATGVPLGEMVRVGRENPEVRVHYSTDEAPYTSSIKIQVTNASSTGLYCCSLYLASNFQSFTGFLKPPVYHLEPDESVTLALDGNSALNIEYTEMMKWYNWEKFSDRLKFIVSTENFQVTGFDLEPLPDPPVPCKLRASPVERKRRVITALPKTALPEGWSVYDINLEFMNPCYNEIDRQALASLLEDPDSDYFTYGLYCTRENGNNAGAGYQLKPRIRLLS